MSARWLAVGAALLLGGCFLCKDDHEVRDAFAPRSRYAALIDACKDDASCAPLCARAFGLSDSDEIVECRIRMEAPTGVQLRVHFIVPSACGSEDDGWDDGWDDGGDDGGYDDGSDSGDDGSDDGSDDDGSDDGGYDDGGDTGDDGGDDGGDDEYRVSRPASERAHVHAPRRS